MLATDAQGNLGGISQYNIDVIEALSGLAEVESVVVVAMSPGDRSEHVPPKVRYSARPRGGVSSFLRASLFEAMKPGGFDIIYCAHIDLMPVAALLGKIFRKPVVLAIYGIDAWWVPKRKLTERASGMATLVLSISQITLDRFREWNPIDIHRTAIVPNAIRVEQFGRAERNSILVERYGLEGRKVIMTFGRMHPDEQAKGFDQVIDVLPTLRETRPDLTYLLVGDGGDRKRLEEKAEALGVDDMVVLTGRIPEETKADHYRLADAYVMPSRLEGFGFVVIEALACGIPVIASKLDGTAEAVRGGELGLIVDPDEPEALRQAIVQTIDVPKEVPTGLEYFSVENFKARIRAALAKVSEMQR